MKKDTLTKRIFALLTAPSILLSSPRTLRSTWEQDGASVFSSSAIAAEGEPCFLSDTFFFGESTTAHLARQGGVLDTPMWQGQVWRDESGTRMLDRRILSSRVNLASPDGGARSLSLEEALSEVQPHRLILSFGLNGLLYFHSNQTAFLGDYRHLIQEIKKLSPATEIGIQSIYPVGENQAFTLPHTTLNSYIQVLNDRLRSFAESADGVTFFDTASLLCDGSGALKKEYDSGDGIHLTNDAYRQILLFISKQIDKENTE